MQASPAEPGVRIEALQQLLQRAEPNEKVDLIETHISWVLLCGPLAYKVKKPVKLGFLDFSTSDARRHACEEELRLNRRLAPGLYIDVLPVTGTPSQPSLAGSGDPIDHVVRMRRFPSGELFSEQLAAGRLETSHVDRFAELIAEFHVAAAVASASSPFNTPQLVESTTLQVLQALEQHDGVPPLAGLRQWLEAQAPTLRAVWQERRQAGRVREGHGDLHLANATVFEGEVVAFDCIEFDPQLRWIDVMSDAAFAAMDFMAHGRRDLAFRFLDGWLERTGDHGGLAVLPYYLVYRAMVRGLVARLRPAEHAPDHLALARQLAGPGDARLMITHGVSGSGKTFVTQRVLEHAGAIRLRSDVERKRLFNLRPLERSDRLGPEVIYGTKATVTTYAALREKARQSLQAGFHTIVDAAFLRRHERADCEQLAREVGVPYTIVHCRADTAELRRRIERRLAGHGDASEADVAVLDRQLAFQEPLTEAEQRHALEVDTQQPFDVDAVCAQWLSASA